MRLKEIKPGMVIHCKTKEDLKKLSDVGISSCFGKRIDEYMKPACFVIIRNGGDADWTISIEEALEYGKITEFSDLILPDPELSAEEALLAYDQMCKEHYCCNDCPIYGIVGHECAHKMDEHITEIVDAIKKWKADREKKGPETEKKEPEIEWFWKSYVVGGSDYKEADTEQEAMEWCEYYAKEHPEAKCTYKHICRAKAVK